MLLDGRSINKLFRISLIAFAGTYFFLQNIQANPANSLPAKDATSDIVEELIEDFSKYVEHRSAFFSIFGENTRKMKNIYDVVDRLEGHVSTVLGWRNFTRNSLISITLIEKDAPLQYRYERDFKGNIRLRLYGKIFELSEFELALIFANALILQYEDVKGLPVDDTKAPLWLATALAKESEIARNGGRYLVLRERAKKIIPLPIDDLLSRKFDEQKFPDEQFVQNAFWFYRYLRKKRVFGMRNYGELVTQILKKPKTFTPKKLTPEEANLHWATAFFSIVERSPAGTENLNISEERFEKRKNFIFEINGKDTLIPAKQLIKVRELNDVKKIAFERANEILNELSHTNPVWFNAFAELGTFLEILAQPEDEKLPIEGTIWTPQTGTHKKNKEDKLLAQWEKVELAEENARKLAKEIKALLNRKK